MNASIESLRDTITPKSDQLNADDLLAGPVVVKIVAVKRGDTSEQPIILVIDGDRQPYKPCKSMRRVMIAAWGDDGREWVGRSMKLFCDPNVKFGGVKVGGIRISHMSGIDSKLSVMLTTTRSKRSEYTVEPLLKTTPMPDKVKQKVAEMRAKPPAATASVINISGDPSEGDLSGIGNNKPSQEALSKVIHAFANIGYTIEALEAEYGKRIDEWDMDDMDEARRVYILKAAERKEMLAKIASDKAAESEPVVI